MRVISHLRHCGVTRSRAVLIAGTAAIAGSLAVPGAALAGALDQQQTDMSGGAQGVNGNGGLTVSAAQTFTAGISGVLDQVDLSLAKNGSPTGDLTVELRATSGGEPGGAVLASQAVPVTSVTTGSSLGFVPVVFPTPAPVVAGTQYAIVAYTADTNGYSWGASPNSGANPTAYASGEAFTADSSPPSTTWDPFTGVDQAFKTYVAPPTPVVQPPTPTPTTSAPAPTGQRAAALKKCKKKHTKQARKKCKKKANKLPA